LSQPDPANLVPLVPPEQLEKHIETLQQQINDLQIEVNLLRHRDETINLYLQRMDDELRLAARLQQDFLPKSLPMIGRVRFYTVYRPASYVSGDLYDVTRLDEQHVGFYMADAVGHGMPAALLTMFIKNALVMKEITGNGYHLLDPADSMRRLNDVLVNQNLSNATFATALYGLINTETLEVKLAKGGHPNPILFGHDGEVRNVEADGSLLGIFADEQFPAVKLQMSPGDRLFVFTDGVELAFSDGAKGVDALRWREELYTRGNLSTEQLLTEFTSRLNEDLGSLTPRDDLTMIVIEALRD
jgi:serine phosphatase RsbU (regulator of sigma subunit)